MYGLAFELSVAQAEAHHPKGVSAAYTEIGAILSNHDFRRIHGGLYVTDYEDMANVLLAIQALRSQPWFATAVRDVRAFHVSQWSDLTPLAKA
jgi:virulence-associated protein VapD